MSCSLLYDNLITSPSMITATSYAPAQVMGITRVQTGGVVFEARGAYTDVLERTYRIEIQTTGTNGALSGSTFRWSDQGGFPWNVEQVVILPATWMDLDYGLQCRFSVGTSQPDVVTGDNWTFRAVRRWGVEKLLDWSRNTEFRSDVVLDGTTYDLMVDFGAAQLPAALVLQDHNLVASTVTRLQSSTTSNFASTPYNVLVPYHAAQLAHLISGASAARYWRLRMTMGTGQTDVRASEWYLGARQTVQPYDIGFHGLLDVVGGDSNGSRLPYGQGVAAPSARQYEAIFGRVQDTLGGDYRTLHTAWEAMNDWRAGDKRPCYLILDDADLTDCRLVHWANAFDAQHRYLDRYDVRAVLQELVRSLD